MHRDDAHLAVTRVVLRPVSTSLRLGPPPPGPVPRTGTGEVAPRLRGTAHEAGARVQL